MNICVYAASSARLAHDYYKAAEDLGRLMAEGGHTLIFGGGADGLMGACARGVQSAGGKMIGVAPRFFDEPGVLLKDGCELVFTETVSERKMEMDRLADAFIALPGGIGTYEEFTETLTLKQLGQHREPMAMLSTMGYYEPFLALMQHTVDTGFMSKDVLSLFTLCQTPAEAMAHVTEPVPSVCPEPSIRGYNR
ncbi:MAG: TIGR00730 family Rossman fold protein [Oscillospiraceae bacterium]|nr:TIGR00730 family Rossman fold protein [Oscillospiraceae bacterium]